MNDAALARRAMALLDLTDLGDAADEAGALALCATATHELLPVAAVCLWPRFVATAREALADSGVRIATVVNFPSGDEQVDAVLAATRKALADGADEIDLVLPWRAFLVGDIAHAAEMVEAVREACDERTLKVILETGEYPDLAHIATASRLAIAGGADFIKTSTGKTALSATPEAARTMLEVIFATGRRVGLKPSGGIRRLADAATYLDLADTIMGPGWAVPATFRFGASGLYHELAGAIAGTSAPTSGNGY